MIWNEYIEAADRDRLKRLQNERFTDMIERIYYKVPFYRKKLTELGLEPVGSDAATFASFVKEEIERAAKLVKDRSVKAD
jgi:phenylacetate-coenzyme A ligase PaaK-like adenylate-forming protein